MGTRAYWLSSPWRYCALGVDGERDGPWVYAETLRHVRSDIEGTSRTVLVQKRTGRKSEGYTYVNHSTIAPPWVEAAVRISKGIAALRAGAALIAPEVEHLPVGSDQRTRVTRLLGGIDEIIAEFVDAYDDLPDPNQKD